MRKQGKGRRWPRELVLSWIVGLGVGGVCVWVMRESVRCEDLYLTYGEREQKFDDGGDVIHERLLGVGED